MELTTCVRWGPAEKHGCCTGRLVALWITRAPAITTWRHSTEAQCSYNMPLRNWTTLMAFMSTHSKDNSKLMRERQEKECQTNISTSTGLCTIFHCWVCASSTVTSEMLFPCLSTYISYCTFGWKDNKKLLGLLKHCIYFYCIFSLWKTNIEKVRLHVQQTITLFTNFTFTHHVKALWKFPWRNAEQCKIWSTQETLKHSLIKRIIYHFTSLNQVFGTHALGLNGKWYTCCR